MKVSGATVGICICSAGRKKACGYQNFLSLHGLIAKPVKILDYFIIWLFSAKISSIILSVNVKIHEFGNKSSVFHTLTF